MKPLPTEFFSTADMLDQMRERGCVFSVRDGAPKVKFSTACPASPGLLEELARRRAEIIEVLQREPQAGGSEFGDRLAQRLQAAEQERREMAALGEARRLLRWLDSNGHRITLTGSDSIQVSPRPSDPETVESLKAHKSELLILLAREQETAG